VYFYLKLQMADEQPVAFNKRKKSVASNVEGLTCIVHFERCEKGQEIRPLTQVIQLRMHRHWDNVTKVHLQDLKKFVQHYHHTTTSIRLAVLFSNHSMSQSRLNTSLPLTMALISACFRHAEHLYVCIAYVPTISHISGNIPTSHTSTFHLRLVVDGIGNAILPILS